MTEDEAKAAKRCPQTLGRVPAAPETCLGSACMAWRWSSESTREETVPSSDLNRWITAGWKVKIAGSGSSLLTLPPAGYCGLAGKLAGHDL